MEQTVKSRRAEHYLQLYDQVERLARMRMMKDRTKEARIIEDNAISQSGKDARG